MKKGLLIGLGVLVILVLIPALTIQSTYNDIVAKEQAVNQQWSQVENVYQRRADLIPNLVATVKGYAAHESEVLETVTAARASVGSIRAQDILNNPAQFQKFQQAESGISGALSRLLVVSENYPNLKANENFLDAAKPTRGHGESHYRGAHEVQRDRSEATIRGSSSSLP